MASVAPAKFFQTAFFNGFHQIMMYFITTNVGIYVFQNSSIYLIYAVKIAIVYLTVN